MFTFLLQVIAWLLSTAGVVLLSIWVEAFLRFGGIDNVPSNGSPEWTVLHFTVIIFWTILYWTML